MLPVPTLPTDPRAQHLMNEQQRELRRLYNDEDSRTEPFDPQTLSGEGSLLLTIEEDGQLLACGALKKLDEESAEIKRMYTVPAARGRGMGRRILSALIEAGRQAGYARLVLETGNQQPEAVHLYEQAGFRRIPNYGYYQDMEDSLCYELRLR
ncbi:GNAT family N-acetyltransferase [Deinococcus deserti]|uniref:Putative acyltransferase n=1 Tax=Deinococcus deserti (strain DSM 17065 / CIP 109153 / LMG 22923 / VCD115) TaxID=546414 RepID=C1D127_DEIDV|nr:GNAT family N-acetyltransferase [Deinococcus deserti]ACO45551.1 putative acyltransferase [Deinococcus deserti VCD115]